MGLVLTYCLSRWHEGVPSDAPQTMDEALARIDELYDSGKLFFTKESIRAVYEQFQGSTGHGEKIFVKDVEGATIEYTLRTGETFPMLRYQGRGHLKHSLRRLYEGANHEPERTSPLRSLQVYQRSEKLVFGTKELVQDPTLPSRDNLNSYFKEQILAWQESEMCKRVVQILDSSVAGHSIEKIVAVALGGISRDDRHSSAFQHALVLTLREWLHARQKSVSCYAQDPAYKAVDKVVLEEHGIEIIDDPRAWLEVDEQSILFSCAPNVPVKEIVADTTRPAAVIWERLDDNDWDVEGEGKFTDPYTPRVRAMLEGYEMFEFGADDHFCSTVIYVRRCRD
ncbi:hypothetical protein N7474_006835 [Penicillium riverlandense]|uniref:uncharacterized protein n=1 Tax=Penicillium riverlandense TaxID=1903569 RepID=UPI0025484AE4|nr:uncharacterized protein N7474_006835 [Penicillium riverlandense]KAJ5815058.1 hypothetical protein N7474_006835 [Penicillium riverlandense]